MGQRSSQLPPNVMADGCLSEVGTNSRLAFRSRKLHFSTGDEPADLCLPHVSVTMRSDEELLHNISRDATANMNGHCRSTEATNLSYPASAYIVFQQEQVAFQKSVFLQQKHLQSKSCQRSSTPTLSSHVDQEQGALEGGTTIPAHIASTSSASNNGNPIFTTPLQYYQNQTQATNVYTNISSGLHQRNLINAPHTQHPVINCHNNYSHGSTTSRNPFVKSKTIDVNLPAHMRSKEAEILRKYSDSSTTNIRQGQSVANLLPEEKGIASKTRRSTSPKLSPYNLSPRSLSPAERCVSLASSTVTTRSSVTPSQFSVLAPRERRPLVVTELNAALNQLTSRQRDALPTTCSNIMNHVPRITISGERSRHISANSTEIINHHLKRLDGVRSEVNSPVNMFTDPSQSKSDTSLSILFTAGLEAPTNDASLVSNSTSNCNNPCLVTSEQPKVGMSPTCEIASSEPTWSSDLRSVTNVKRGGGLLQRSMTVDCEVPPDLATNPISALCRPTSILDNMRWPAYVPAQLQAMLQKSFQGHQLLTWLCNNINNVHFRSSRSELYLLVSQMCTCLIATDVLKPTETIKETPPFFKPEHLYTWSPWLRQQSPNLPSDASGTKATSTSGVTNVQQLHLEHEELINKIHRDHIEEVDRLRQENDLRIFQVKNESVMKVCQLRDRIEQLEQQVEKYRILAGIEGLLSLHEKVWNENENQSSSLMTVNNASTDTNELPFSKPGSHCGTTCESAMQTRLIMAVDQAIQCEERSQPPPRPKAPPLTAQITVEPPPAPPPPTPAIIKGSTPPPPPPPVPLPRSQSSSMHKPPQLIPTAPMKTLFWKPIRLNHLPQGQGKLWHDLSNSLIDIKVATGSVPFQQIFARPTVADSLRTNHLFDQNKKPSHLRRTKSSSAGECKQPTKLLDSKRATNLAIFVTANQLTPEMVREALMLFDCGLLSLECMQMLQTVAPTDEDIESIRNHMKNHPDTILDQPEQFLLGLSEIAGFSDRLACLLMQYEHADAVASMECRLLAMVSCCQSLLTDDQVHNVLGLLLAIGNFMNAGSNHGNADGFGLDILNKLRDVKSTESNCTLLDYLVHQYISTIWRADGDITQMRCPLPEATDLQRASEVDLNSIVKEINEIGMQVEAFQRRAQRVLQRYSNSKSDNSHGLEPFCSATNRFFVTAKADIDQLHATLAEARSIFAELVVFYSDCNSLTPTDFFKLWLPFCADFKDQMRKQLQLRLKKK